MNDPLELLELAVAGAREIPELVDAVGGDAQRIEAFRPRWPEAASVLEALDGQPPRSVRFILQRTEPATGGIWWRHVYLVQFRPDDERGEAWGGQWRMARALINGRLTDGGRWLYRCFRPATDAVRTVTVAPRVYPVPGGVAELLVGTFVIGDGEA